ncbi:MAG: CrcB family protein [Actinobacteria bacterium]|nr:CrcB family protein [Actinomycetota bacterium]
MTAAAFVVLAAAGTLARLLVGRRLNGGLPFGTALVNVAGSFALGLLHGASPAVLTAVGAGGLGAFTTFSTFAADAVALGARRRRLAAAVYVAASVIAGVAAAALGLAISRGS